MVLEEREIWRPEDSALVAEAMCVLQSKSLTLLSRIAWPGFSSMSSAAELYMGFIAFVLPSAKRDLFESSIDILDCL